MLLYTRLCFVIDHHQTRTGRRTGHLIFYLSPPRRFIFLTWLFAERLKNKSRFFLKLCREIQRTADQIFGSIWTGFWMQECFLKNSPSGSELVFHNDELFSHWNNKTPHRFEAALRKLRHDSSFKHTDDILKDILRTHVTITDPLNACIRNKSTSDAIAPPCPLFYSVVEEVTF